MKVLYGCHGCSVFLQAYILLALVICVSEYVKFYNLNSTHFPVDDWAEIWITTSVLMRIKLYLIKTVNPKWPPQQNAELQSFVLPKWVYGYQMDELVVYFNFICKIQYV